MTRLPTHLPSRISIILEESRSWTPHFPCKFSLLYFESRAVADLSLCVCVWQEADVSYFPSKLKKSKLGFGFINICIQPSSPQKRETRSIAWAPDNTPPRIKMNSFQMRRFQFDCLSGWVIVLKDTEIKYLGCLWHKKSFLPVLICRDTLCLSLCGTPATFQ